MFYLCLGLKKNYPLVSHTSVSVLFLDRNQTCIGSFFPFMETGPLCSRWNWGSEFSGVIRHLELKTKIILYTEDTDSLHLKAIIMSSCKFLSLYFILSYGNSDLQYSLSQQFSKIMWRNILTGAWSYHLYFFLKSYWKHFSFEIIIHKGFSTSHL